MKNFPIRFLQIKIQKKNIHRSKYLKEKKKENEMFLFTNLLSTPIAPQ